MLFSHAETAEWIGGRFEAAWRTLRPVPVIRVDFGDGREVTRTLHGNVVTWVCTPDGEVVDGLPGLYDAATYRARLEEIAKVAARVADLTPAERRAAMDDYHRARGSAAIARRADLSKSRIERPLERAVAPKRVLTMPTVVSSSKEAIERPLEKTLALPSAIGPVAQAIDPLAEDTRRNEAERRPALHEVLLAAGPVRPDAVERRVYREILHADLDDPWLGLSEALFDPGDPRRSER